MGPQPLGAATRIQKAGDIGQFVRRLIPWKRLQENFTIGHPLEPGIQQRQHAAVRLCANQSPKALLQGQNSLRHLKFRKRVAPVFLKRLHPGRYDGVARNRKREPVDDQDRKSTRLNSSHRSLSRMPSSA